MQRKLEDFIKQKADGKNVVVGLSGGIDSSLACILAKNALGADRVHGLVLANSKFAQEVGLDQVRDFASKHNITLSEINISEVRTQVMNTLQNYDAIHKPTVDVRLCDLYLRLYASSNNCLYLGTINATERVTGWFPKGALTGDYDLLGDLFKVQIKGLAKHMGLGHLIPTVSEEAKHICSGCGELPEFEGISYDTLDDALLIYRTNPQNYNLICEEKGIKKDFARRILNRIEQTAHKRETFPEYPVVN